VLARRDAVKAKHTLGATPVRLGPDGSAAPTPGIGPRPPLRPINPIRPGSSTFLSRPSIAPLVKLPGTTIDPGQTGTPTQGDGSAPANSTPTAPPPRVVVVPGGAAAPYMPGASAGASSASADAPAGPPPMDTGPAIPDVDMGPSADSSTTSSAATSPAAPLDTTKLLLLAAVGLGGLWLLTRK
jgi:hypothetical protein